MIHAISVLLDDKVQLCRKLGPAETLIAAYELAGESADELALAFGDNSIRGHRLLLRAHFVALLETIGDDARDFLRSLLEETATQPNTPLG